MLWFLISAYTFAGAFLGSFTTAIVHRLKHGESWIRNDDKTAARSACPKCQRTLSVFDLIPVFSWLYFKGRCRQCLEPISKQYIFTELLSAFLGLLIFLALGATLESAFSLLLLPFLLAQMTLFVQKRFISAQLCFIMGVIVIAYGVSYYT